MTVPKACLDHAKVQAVGVVVIDDHPVTREGMAALVNALPGFTVLAGLADPTELPPDLTADVVIHDLYLADGQPAIVSVTELAADGAKVLVMSASRAPADVLAVVRAGASGYVTKDASAAAIGAALSTVAVGGFALSPQLADILSVGLSAAPQVSDDRTQALSAREREVLDLIAAGYTHAQTARRMDVSKSTVDTYVERIRTKLQVGNKAELVKVALEQRRAPGRESDH